MRGEGIFCQCCGSKRHVGGMHRGRKDAGTFILASPLPRCSKCTRDSDGCFGWELSNFIMVPNYMGVVSH